MAETDKPNSDQPQDDEPVGQTDEKPESPQADQSQPQQREQAPVNEDDAPAEETTAADTPAVETPEADGDEPVEQTDDQPEATADTEADEDSAQSDDGDSPEPPAQEQAEQADDQADTAQPDDGDSPEPPAKEPAEQTDSPAETPQPEQPVAQEPDTTPAAAAASVADNNEADKPAEEPAAAGAGFDASAFLDEHHTPWYKHAPVVPLLLGFNTLVVLFLLAIIVFALSGGKQTPDQAQAHGVDTAVVERPSADSEYSPIDPPRVEAQAWRKAEKAFANQDFSEALGYYRHLLASAEGRPVDAFVVDYLRLRSGDCLISLGRSDEGRQLLQRVSGSGSPVVRAVSNYQLAELELRTQRYPAARRRAYAALAALGAIEQDMPLGRDCDYLIARSLTESALQFYNPDEPIPWPGHNAADPFSGLDDVALRRLLHDGAERMAESVLGPKVEKAGSTSAAQFWSVSCWQATLEEVLYRFASECKMNIHWAAAAPPVRRRGISLAFRQVGEHRLFEVACGMAGLIARFARDEVEVHDPDAISSLSQKRELLKAEAISAWRRFFLRAPDDTRLPVGHFVLGRLYECAGEINDSIREYRLTAGRFPRNELAPRALLRKARIQISLRDFAGARSDLMDLLDMYPDYPAVDEVYLFLGRSALNIGLWDEAIRTYRKLYYLDLSKASRQEACRGVARSFFEKGNYTESCKWYERYFRSIDEPSGETPAEAFHTWARSEAAMGNMDKAAAAYRLSLGAGGTTELCNRASLDLAGVELERQNFVAALAILNELDAGFLSEQQNYVRLRLQARVLREMGLPLRARRMLSRHMPEVSDPHNRAMLGYEVAKCMVAEDKRGEARDVLANVLGAMAPSAESHEAALYLGRLCLEDGRYRQAAEVSRALLDSSATGHIRRQAQELLGMARAYERDYEAAADAFSRDVDEFVTDVPGGGRESTP